MTALPHADEDAAVFGDAVFLEPARVDQERDLFTAFGAQRDVDLLEFALEFQERKKMRLIKDPAARGKDDLKMLPLQLVAIVASHLAQGRVHPQDGTVVRENEETAGRVVERTIHLECARHSGGGG